MFYNRSLLAVLTVVAVLAAVLLAGAFFGTSHILAQGPSPARGNSPSLFYHSAVSPLDAYYAQRAQQFIEQQRPFLKVLAPRQLSPSELYYMQRALRYMRLARGLAVDDLPQ